jgi:hypothetical protein
VIHITTGAVFLGGAWLLKGRQVRVTNFFLGIFYILFGVIENFNWPHIIAGIVSVAVSIIFKPRKSLKDA